MTRRLRVLRATTALVLVVTGVAACSVETTPVVKVTATDTTCDVDRHEAPGGEIQFEVDNNGDVVTEVYLYGPGDRIMNEVENVDAEEKGTFLVKVGGGSYEVACKPNMVGDGIRQPFTVTGTPDPELLKPVDAATLRGVASFPTAVTVADDAFAPFLAQLIPTVNQTVEFQVTNTSTTQEHGFAVAGVDGATMKDTGPIAPLGTVTLPVTFKVAGDYTAYDSVGANRQNGFESTFKVVT